MVMSEKQIVLPLDAEEMKDGLITKICESLYEALNKTCNLYGCAYPKFKASGTITLQLDNFGDVRLDVVKFESESEGEFHNPVNLTIQIEIPEMPPNVFRRQTGQSIPVVVEKDDGSVEQKAIFYRRETTPRIGRANKERNEE